MLRIEAMGVRYGGLQALDGVSLCVGGGELVSIVGANGAGKTTLLKAISGTVPASGAICFADQDISTRPAHLRARAGIVHVPQGRHIFGSMSVEENLLVAATYRGTRARDDAARIGGLDAVYELFPALFGKRRQAAGLLSGGQQQMLAIGRGLMAEPVLLMLDEPSTGISPALVDDIFEAILQIHARHALALLLVEQRATTALEISQRAYVLEQGRVAVEGAAAQLRSDDRVRRAYLGV